MKSVLFSNYVAGCPGSDWVPDGSKCYLVVEKNMTWDQAIDVRIFAVKLYRDWLESVHQVW